MMPEALDFIISISVYYAMIYVFPDIFINHTKIAINMQVYILYLQYHGNTALMK